MQKPRPSSSGRRNGNVAEARPGLPAGRAALGRADRLAAVGQLASGLAHEMNTPLATITVHAEESLELLDERQPTAAELADLRGRLQAILRQANRCSQIASRMLQIARPKRAVCEQCDTCAVIDDVVNLFSLATRRRKVQLRTVVPPKLAVAPIGPADLEQLLVNLVQNGLDACHGAGTISIEAADDEGQLQLIVTDDGAGIAADVLPRVFDPFFTTKPVGQGTGLGLCVCHGIVQTVGGAIEVTSALGEGTRVTVSLPLQPAPSGALASTSA
jgi:two-component system NtrC family sensor kinase